ncbi:hypothetical protein C8R45DRAFT_1102570 [Mycena sanguinolenta]|nr:hypothetical protein C8R45DRAFT_1102570 [Mycena sanguinolenta]
MDSLAAIAQDLRLDSYAAAACLTLLTYDTFLNLSLEYRYIWRSKWGLINCLYLWSRYGTFLDTSLNLLTEANVNLDPSTCSTLAKFISIYSGFGVAVTEIIMMVRTYALYGRSKRVVVFLVLMWLAIGAIGTWSAFDSLKKSESTPVVQSLPDISCELYGSSNDILLLCFVSMLAGETVIVLLTLWKALHTFYWQADSAFKSPGLLINFYRDGVLFYLAMLLVVLQSDAPEALKSIGHTPLRVIHSILACHLVVHIRVVASEDENCTAIQTPIVFANFSVESGRRIDSGA